MATPEAASQRTVFAPMGLKCLRRTLVSSKRNTVPMTPREKASIPEEKGICLRKMPMVPKINMEVISISSGFLAFWFIMGGSFQRPAFSKPEIFRKWL